MSKKTITKPPGVEDIFPDKIPDWNIILNTAKDVFSIFNYKEIIIPIFEYTEVFSRGLGEETDIVSKEMFSFEDRGGRSLTLRPEGTASVVRAYVENGEYNRLSSCKLFYVGPMFRAERPQKGRQKQFTQFGAEIFGSGNPFHDFEMISMMDSISMSLGITDFSILINSIGCPLCRENYVKELKTYYSGHSDRLCNDCSKRVDRNPLRLLDCKNENCKELKDKAPVISSYLCEECREHHSKLKEYLDINNIDYKEEPHLVRGLDYYTKTTFEFVSEKLGGQNAFAAGGRYDNLVETFGGKPTPAVGFAAGMERISLLIKREEILSDELDIFLIYSGENAYKKSIQLSNLLRTNNISADIDPNSKSIKSQFKKADRENAKWTIIIGEDEIADRSCTIKNMKSGEQKKVDEAEIIDFLNSHL